MGLRSLSRVSAEMVASWAKMVGAIVSSTLESGSNKTMAPVDVAILCG